MASLASFATATFKDYNGRFGALRPTADARGNVCLAKATSAEVGQEQPYSYVTHSGRSMALLAVRVHAMPVTRLLGTL
jgi:hypothetical protein